MKNYLWVLLVCILTTHQSYADAGYCYCFEASVQTKNTVLKGYFEVLTYDEVGNLEKKEFVKNNQTFTQFVKQYTSYDSLNLFKDRLVVGNSMSVLLHKLSDIAWNDVRKMTYHSVSPCFVGTSVITPLSLTDKSWVTKPPLKRETMPESEACDYDILYYAKKDKGIENLLIQLQKATKENQKIAPLLEALKRKKVLIGLSCSC